MTVRSTQLAHGGTGTTGATDIVLATAPAGYTLIVKDVLLTLQSTGVSSTRPYIGLTGSVLFLLAATTNVAGGIVIAHFTGFAVVLPGNQLRLSSNLAAGSVADCLVSGAKLLGLSP